MCHRKPLRASVELASCLALLAFVLVASSRVLGGAFVATHGHQPPHKFTVLPGPPSSTLGPVMVADATPRLKALPSEGSEQEEEEDGVDALVVSRTASVRPDMIGEIATRRMTCSGSTGTVFHLRC